MLHLNLLHSILVNEDYTTLFKVLDDYLDKSVIKYFHYAKEVYREYKKLPTPQAVESEFDIEFEETTEPAEYWLNRSIKKYQQFVVEDAIKDAIKTKDIEIFKAAILKHNLIQNSSIINFSERAKDRKENYYELKDNKIKYLSTGNDILDELTLGYYPTDYWLVGGEEGIGKTWWLLNRAYDVSKVINKQFPEKQCLFISGEIDAMELEERLDSINSKVPYSRLISGELLPEQEKKYFRSLSLLKMRKSNISIIDDCFSIKDVEMYLITHSPAIVFLDGIHLFSDSFDWKDVMKVSVKIKEFTRKYKIPFVVTSHLREGKGKNEQAADNSSFAYFKGARDPDNAFVMFQDEEMELIGEIGLKRVKGRKKGRFVLHYEVDYNTSEEVIKYHKEL